MLIDHLFLEHRDLSDNCGSSHDGYLPHFSVTWLLQAPEAAKAIDRVGIGDKTGKSESIECSERSRVVQDCLAVRILETVPGDRHYLHPTMAEPVHENEKQPKRRQHRPCATRFLRRVFNRRFSSQIHQSPCFAQGEKILR